jgi:hypothetical protein
MITESYEDSLSLMNDWKALSGSGKGIWKRTTGASYTGSASVMVNNFSETWNTELVELISPSYNLSVLKTPELNYKVAYCRKDSNTQDILRIFVSTDCGRVWTPRYSRLATALATAPDQKTAFVPASQAEWKEDKFTITGSYATSTNLMFKIQLTCSRGNNIYLDDINIRDASVGVEETGYFTNFSVFPNPVADEPAVLECSLAKPLNAVSLTVTDILGRTIKTVLESAVLRTGTHRFTLNATADLAPGVYLLRFASDEITRTEKIVIE